MIYVPVDEESETQWASLIFELFNITNKGRLWDIRQCARQGSLSKEEWMKRTYNIEFESVLRTASFYRQYWLPNLQRHQIPPGPHSAFEWYQAMNDDLPPSTSYIEDLEKIYADQILPYRK